MENENIKKEQWYQTITIKMVILSLIGLGLLIPLQMVKMVIRERAQYADEARIEIGKLWAASQTITGPVLNVPGSRIISEDGKTRTITTTLHILPENLNISAVATPEIRYRGIYETVVYDSEVELSGNFIVMPYLETDGFTYDWKRAYFSIGVSDNKGLKDKIVLISDGVSVEAEPGTVQNEVFKKGISFPFPIADIDKFSGVFNLTFKLKGSEGLYFSPVGKTTSVALTSSWTAPSFKGNFLPNEREIGDNGFTAEWVVTHLNRNFPQAWTGGVFLPENDAFGADLMLEIDHYKKAERSAKYGLLFILITFFVLIIIEIRSSERIHIFYYVLVALALILFFSLLSALSEHLGFNPAYLIASVATIGLLTAFFRSLVSKNWVIVVISGLLSTLYLFIFILLALKDYAYLAGNIGLFVLLAALMMASSKYRIFSNRTI